LSAGAQRRVNGAATSALYAHLLPS